MSTDTAPTPGPAATIVHNLNVVHARPGWTKADALKAVADGRANIRYTADVTR